MISFAAYPLKKATYPLENATYPISVDFVFNGSYNMHMVTEKP
jgi:hypothetical protein